jgi:hypothetical protein
MEEGTTYVGMDVHKRTIAVTVRFPGGGRDERTIPHETRAVNRVVRKLKREAPGAILCAYEAGPCGYGLQRDLQEQGLECQDDERDDAGYRERDEARDVERDEARDVERDDAGYRERDEVRDEERDEVRDAKRDATRDVGRDEARDAERDKP